jgi:hypothetical protein
MPVPANPLRLALLVLCVSAGAAHAAKGYVVTEEIQTPGGKPAKKVIYLSETAQRSEDPDKTALLILKNADLKLYQIDDKTRVVKDSSALAPMMLMAYAVFLDRDANGKARVKQDFATPTDETKPIGKWLARKVVTRPMGLTAYGWYTKDSPEMIGDGRTAATRVVSVESRDIPDSVFELPKGYKLENGMVQGK